MRGVVDGASVGLAERLELEHLGGRAGGDGGAQSSAVPSGFFGRSRQEVGIGLQRSRMPKITLKRRRREDRSGGDTATNATAAVDRAPCSATKRVRVLDTSSSPNTLSSSMNDDTRPATSSAVLSLAAYASSSDSEDET